MLIVLDNYDSFTYNLVQYVGELGVEPTVYRNDAITPEQVLAVVEVKRNLNDLAHGFGLRQENLAWLTGDTAHYDPGQCRTTYFRSGHFDREAIHQQDGDSFVFARSSFSRFRRDPAAGLFLDRLCFITRAGTMWGVSTAALARLGLLEVDM